jgi:OOP family OmpA-OmpF porin
MPNIIETLSGIVSREQIEQQAALLQESPASISKTLSYAFPSILAGFMSQSGNPGTLHRLFSMLTDPANRPMPSPVGTTGAAPTPASPLGGSFLSAIFGDHLGAVQGLLGERARVKRSSAASLLSWAAPLVMSVLGERARNVGLSGMLDWLRGQQTAIAAAAPAGLADAIGLDRRPAVSNLAAPPRREREASRWLPFALTAAAALIGLVWAARAFRDNTSTAARVPEAQRQTTKELPPDLGEWTTRTLPTKVQLRLPERGVETRVLTFIEDPQKRVDKTSWFDFDRLRFENGSATLRPESREQLKNVAAILQAYPDVRIKIGGYTDTSGEASRNQKLSEERARNVQKELVALGVPPEHVTAEGYGGDYPVADNSTEQGRQQNRRISMLVIDK